MSEKNKSHNPIDLSIVKATKKIVLAEFERRLIENDDMPRNEASVFLLNALGASCTLEGINTKKIKAAFNSLSNRNKQIFLKGMALYNEREKTLEDSFKEGNTKGLAKLPYHLYKTVVKGGTTGFSIGLAVNQIFPSLLPVYLGNSIEKLPDLVAKLNIGVPEYIDTLLKTVSLFGASAIPENIYHGVLLAGATVAGVAAYTVTKGAASALTGLCKVARKKQKEHKINTYIKKNPEPLLKPQTPTATKRITEKVEIEI